MPVFNQAQAGDNPVLKLAVDLRQRTHGLCDIGIGPWGFGVANSLLTKVGVVVCMDPNPCGDEPLPPEVKEYTMTVRPICNAPDSAQYGKGISMDDLQQLCGDEDILTRTVASVLLELSTFSATVSDWEHDDAFEKMFEAAQHQDDRFTAEEAKELDALRWYETKTPEEIVGFQLGENRLCMPMERFREMAEEVFQRPIETRELQFCRQEFLEEFRGLIANSAPAQESGPAMTMS